MKKKISLQLNLLRTSCLLSSRYSLFKSINLVYNCHILKKWLKFLGILNWADLIRTFSDIPLFSVCESFNETFWYVSATISMRWYLDGNIPEMCFDSSSYVSGIPCSVLISVMKSTIYAKMFCLDSATKVRISAQ